MVAKSSTPVLGPITHFVAAALAGIITIGILASVTELFLRDGRPMERLAAAERAWRRPSLRFGARSLHARMGGDGAAGEHGRKVNRESRRTRIPPAKAMDTSPGLAHNPQFGNTQERGARVDTNCGGGRARPVAGEYR